MYLRESQLSRNKMEVGKGISLHLSNTWCVDAQAHLPVWV